MSKKRKDDPSAIITRISGEKINIHFVCVLCQRISIFANEFVDKKGEQHLEMQCPECYGKVFHVRCYAEE